MPLRQASYVRYKCVIQIKMPRKIDIASSSKRVDVRQMITIPHEIYFLPRARAMCLSSVPAKFL